MKLKIEGLSAGYDKDFVIKDLSLSVNQGEFLSLLGPSGCGKTTLMKAVAGILPAQGGRIGKKSKGTGRLMGWEE